MTEPVRSLDRISIPNPCDADWDSMIGNDQVRFCSHCKLQVTNLSSMKRRDAMLLVARSQGRLCVRFVQGPGGGVLTKEVPEKLHHIVRRVSRIAAGAFTAAMTLSNATAQTSVDSKTISGLPSAARVIPSTNQGAGVSGLVTDPGGAMVPGVTLTITNKNSHTVFVYVTKEDGRYEFALLEAGQYILDAEAPGFAKPASRDVELETNSIEISDFALQIPPIIAEVEIKAESLQSVTQGVVMISEPSDPLIKAAYKNDLGSVRALIPTTADINANDADTNTSALAYAVENHNSEMVHALLAAGANINSTNGSGRTALMHLGKEATADFVRELIAAGAEVNARDEDGETVMMIIARSSTFEVFKELVAAGAHIDAKDNSRDTVLMRAAENDDDRVVKFLIEVGASVDARNEDGESALQIALSNGRGEVLKVLIEAGAVIGLDPRELNAAMLLAARNEDPEVVKLVLKAGGNPNAADAEKTTVLMMVAEHGTPESLKAVIDAGAELNAVNDRGWTAIMHADDIENVLTLLNAGADVTIKNNEGETALEMAIRYDQADVVRLLKSRGAPQ